MVICIRESLHRHGAIRLYENEAEAGPWPSASIAQGGQPWVAKSRYGETVQQDRISALEWRSSKFFQPAFRNTAKGLSRISLDLNDVNVE
jgi:hypothetical protein